MRRLAVLITLLAVAGTSSVALADISPEPPVPEEDGGCGGDEGCSATGQSDPLIGLAVGVLLISGVALRRRKSA